jgi:hypothetical protein
MVALIAIITIAEALQGDSAVDADSYDADTFEHLNIARRIPR